MSSKKYLVLAFVALIIFLALPVKYTKTGPYCQGGILASSPPQCGGSFVFIDSTYYDPLAKVLIESQTEDWDWQEPVLPTTMQIDYTSVFLTVISTGGILYILNLLLKSLRKPK